MSIVISHPTGNRNVRAVIRGLEQAGMLAEFHTTLAADSTASWIKLLPIRFRNEWLRKTYPVSAEHLHTHPALELARMVLSKLGMQYPLRHEKGWASVDAVYTNLDRIVAKRLPKSSTSEVNAVYAYEDGALSTFTRAKQLGLKCIYDLPIAFWETGRKLMIEEAERLPQWAHTLGGGITDSPAKLERKNRELEMADCVICPGKFVKDSLPVWATKAVIVSPFGSPPVANNQISSSSKTKDRPLRVLFVGSMGQRKGLGDLFAAFRLLNRKDIELVVMGSLMETMEFYRSELSNFTYEPGRQHEKVLELMRSCDILCLPSIVEGRALVMQEAMSQGLPIIITANTGGDDLVIEGSTGFLVGIRSPEAIAQKLMWFLENRSDICEMGNLAKNHAAKYTWEKYELNIINGLTTFLN